MSEPKTTIDHAAAFRRIIDHAVAEAQAGHVSNRVIAECLRSMANRVEDAGFRRYVPPRMHDSTGKPIDFEAKAQEAQRERQRRIDEASQIPPDQRQSAVSGYRK